MREPLARLGGLWGSALLEVSHDPAVLDGTGRWAVVLPYEGVPVLARFAEWSEGPPEGAIGAWQGPVGPWHSSLDEAGYIAAVESTREAIAEGAVYQANICRVLSAPLADPGRADVAALHLRLDEGNPAPYGGFVRLPDHGVELATASPELFLSRVGAEVMSGPIKGTGSTAADLSEKDRAENVMIVDLVRNDLSRSCEPGSVQVPQLLAVEPHPGLVHLVSRVSGTLRSDAGWAALLNGAFPPGSVTGAPKSSALRVIAESEPEARGPYCGAVGWVDADSGEGCLAVAIRTFWIDGGRLHFGTGAGITWGSDAKAEWQETELKASRLVRLATGEQA